MIDRELQPDERAVLRAWAEPDVPGEFADEVLARWEAEREAGGVELDEPPARIEARVVQTRRIDHRDARIGWWCGIAAAAAAIALALTMAWSQGGPARTRGELSALPPTPELGALRTEAHAYLLARCTPCHLGRGQDAEPEAIAAFDLGDPRWHDALAPEQLVAAVARMDEKGSADEAARFRRYVDAELAHRSAAAR